MLPSVLTFFVPATSQVFLDWLYKKTEYLPEPFHGKWRRQREPVRQGPNYVGWVKPGQRYTPYSPGEQRGPCVLLKNGEGVGIRFEASSNGTGGALVAVTLYRDSARDLLGYLLDEAAMMWPEVGESLRRKTEATSPKEGGGPTDKPQRQAEDEAGPWDAIASPRWRNAVRLWHKGYDKGYIARQMKLKANTVEKRFSEFRGQYGQKVVPYKVDLRN